MKKSLRASAILAVVICSFAIVSAQQAYRVVGYYPTWKSTSLPVASIKFSELTHINYAFGEPAADGSLIGISRDTALIEAAHRAGCKVLLSIGGASSNSVFSPMAANSTTRQAFVNNLLAYIVAHRYDGADFDWESDNPITAADSANELALMKQTHDAFYQADSSLLITMAIGSSPYTGAHRNYALLSQYVDWYNVMTYDLDQGWSGYSGYNAALYADGFSNDYSVDQSVTYLSGGRFPLIPKSKVVVGVPFYGKQFNSATFNTQFTGSPGYPLYSDIVKLTGWTRNWDDKAKVPYLSNGSSVITYDDSMSIALKCQYAKSRSLAGIMIWEISQDVIGSTQPLLDVIWDQLRSSPDHIQGSTDDRVLEYRLFDNYPNPFNPSTIIRFSVPQASPVALRVFDLLGREIATLVFEALPAGTYSREWNAANLSSGVYFYRLQAGSYVETKRLVLLR